MKKTKVTRRHFNKSMAAAGVATTLLPNELLSQNKKNDSSTDEYDYIIVGSGAGGGPLAANLAKHGFTVLVLEAGEKDPKSNNYSVPAFHAFASEDPALSWSYFVKHYSGNRDQQDSKYVPGKGILYPRGATIGGSTAVNALITVYPHASDFEYIAELTGDTSWNADNMRKYLSYVEDCQYLFNFQAKKEKHGTDGWLPTNYFNFDLGTLLQNTILLGVITANLDHNGSNLGEYLFNSPKLDVNNLYFQDGGVGPVKIPQTMGKDSKRHAVREYLLNTQQQHPDKLIIKTNALVSKVLFDDDKNAIGVEYLEGNNLYKADPKNTNNNATKRIVKARREVILSAGAFNTPQILQLSGIGDRSLLEEKEIPVVHHLPGVGKNLQDRYEVGVTYKLNGEIAESCSFGEGYDPCLRTFNQKGQGVYTTSGSVAANIFKTDANLKDPDIFNFCLASVFNGYYPGYSEAVKENRDHITWAILKGHTNNTAGEVKIEDTNPMNTPNINFKYFNDGTDFNGQDMTAMVKAVKNIRSLMKNRKVEWMVEEEVWPGDDFNSDAKLKDIIGKETWGHHASCTCKIGNDDDPLAVLDSNFKVRGVNKLRVVDASVFPKIPGFFIAVPIYLISEKATDAILSDAGTSRNQNILSRRIGEFKANKEQHIANEIKIKAYPNPTVDTISFEIKTPKEFSNYEIIVFDNSSKVLKYKQFKSNELKKLDVSNLSSGIYHYIIKFGIHAKKGKFIKK